jgi:23S rRNA (adenine2503-C2)-methyltransferase
VKPDLKKLPAVELAAVLAGLGQPDWQVEAVRRALFARGVRSIDGLTSLPKAARADLGERFTVFTAGVAERRAAADGTTKLLLRLEDGAAVETVLMPQGVRLTQCLSSQAGCPLACAFCRTGALGLTRNLHPAEIVDQWLVGREAWPPGKRVTNVVFMGMGEPLLNREAVREAVAFLTSPAGAGISAARITVSTAGIVPGILWMAEHLPQVKLAVSLNAPEDALRSRLMPVNRRYPLRDLISALRRHPTGRRAVTIEYVLLGGVNDGTDLASKLVGLLRGVRCTVNLIPFNPHSGLPWKAPAPADVSAFQSVLRAAGMTAIVRKSQGSEIGAACGQLGAAPPHDLPPESSRQICPGS